MQNPLTLLSIDAFKDRIDKTGATNDDVLRGIIVESTRLANTFTGRNLRIRKYGTGGLPAVYLDGTGTPDLYAPEFPVYAISTVEDDVTRLFDGSNYLKVSTDYLIAGNAGLIRLETDAAKGAVWQKGTGNVKLAYTGGYGTFEILDGINDALDFEETSASELTATVAEGVYDVAALITALKTALDAAGASVYTITYDWWTGKFKLASDRAGGGGTFKLLSSGGSSMETSIWRTLGFITSADAADAASHTADNPSLGVPEDIQRAVLHIAYREFKLTPGLGGGDRFDIRSEVRSGSGGGTRTFQGGSIPEQAASILDNYLRPEL